MNKEKVFVSVIDHDTSEVHVYHMNDNLLHGTNVEDLAEIMDDFLSNHNHRASNSDYTTSSEFPLKFYQSDKSILDTTMYRLRDEAYKRIRKHFTDNPNAIVELSEWRVFDSGLESFKLEYIDDTFMFDNVAINLSDFCLEDLLFILEQFEQ